ncbi:MAG: glycosyltransferase family 2 protein [Candidatus Micrarchaeota archaeon]|nr:glycosyltransferase family 2 protein [Candidatus Micrarchaeota archaeon]
MYGLYSNAVFQAYAVLLALMSVFLAANTLMPRKREVYKQVKGYRPRVLVIIPCKGVDIGLEENLNAVKGQSYRNYKAIAVVGSADDGALRAIRKTSTDFIVADFKNGKCSAKVRSLASALVRFKDFDAYVILDSDALVGSKWLEMLVVPLADKRIGISTAFQLFQPVGGFWSKVKKGWGFVGQSLMERKMTRFGWGGSLAFRKGLLSGRKDFDYFASSISDDIAITRIARRKGLGIAYVPEANPIVRTDDTFPQFIEWSNRQTAFSIAGSRRILYYGIAFYSVFAILLVSAIILAALVNALFGILLVPFAVGAIALYLRSGRDPYMVPAYFMVNFLYLYNLLTASGMKTIEWRGITYDITKMAD